MKYALRFINVLVALFVAYNAFLLIYDEFYSYLPDYNKLYALNNASNNSTVLRENSTGLRDLYNNAFEKSLIYSAIVFAITLITFEYIRAGNLIKIFLSSLLQYFNFKDEPIKKYEDL